MEPTKGGLFSVRRAAAADAEAILGLITDLAVQHNARDMIVYTADDLRRIGFEAEKPQFEAFVAENTDGKIIGCVVFFERFSTWKGPSIHIEDRHTQANTPDRNNRGICLFYRNSGPL